MEKGNLLYEGKAKKVFETEDPDLLIVSYKDDATAFNGQKKGTIQNKGAMNNRISNKLMRVLEKQGIPTHLVEELSDRDTLVRKVSIVPLEVIIRNVAAGSMSKKYGVPEGTDLKCPVLEYSYKNDDLGDPLITESHILALDLATKEELDEIARIAYQVNKVLSGVMDAAGLRLIDFKIEFGRFHGKILLADEISPDTCRFWDKNTGEKLDKDRFRRDLGNVEEAYMEIERRLKELD